MALGLAQAGATTVLCSRHADGCEDTARDIAERTGQRSIGTAADVTVREDVERLVARTVEAFGRIDILVTSAGINIRHPIEEFPPEEYQKLMDLNVTGTWLCCRAAVPFMKKQRSGSVITVGSVLSSIGLAERSPYCAAKSAIIGLTKALALEWASYGVRCNAICPGPFLTEMNRPLLKEPQKVEALLDRNAFRRWGELQEIRGAAVYLASDASSFVTGTALYVDGGWTAG